MVRIHAQDHINALSNSETGVREWEIPEELGGALLELAGWGP